ncbi:leucine-rich repeat domain-containing protein, partial [Barnesiella sp. An22]|uniref:leucine-rich repeat domain-containing protein n=1 Tax=Barnesiella sp. An22 TaxID=1965590 RepID=UPI0011789BD5
MKRFYMLLLFVVVAMNCLYASVHTGSCGPNVTYSLDTETRVLTISGTGAMKDYSKSGAPWYSRNNSYIERVVIEDGVTTIGDYSFEWCYRLSSVSIPNSVTSIGEHAFENCTLYLSSVTIGNSVTSIGEYAFNGCSRLSSITIGNSVKSIGSAAFEDCSALTAVHYTGDEAGWCEIRFDDYEANPLYYAHNLYIDNTLVTDLVIPESVTEIKDYAFSGCSVTQVTIGNSVTSIGDYAFCKCSGLSSVTIG